MRAPTNGQYGIRAAGKQARDVSMSLLLGLLAVAAAGYAIGRFSDIGIVNFFRRLRAAH